MELPAELRIMIAEHALHEPEGLYFNPKPSHSRRRVGVFENVNHVRSNPLQLVCRRLYHETARVEFKVNKIVFDGGRLRIWNTLMSTIKACRRVLKHNNFYFLQRVKVIDLRAQVGYSMGTVAENLKPMFEFAAQYPQFSFAVYNQSWKVFGEDNLTDFANKFVQYGRGLEDIVASAPGSSRRNWRVYPGNRRQDDVELLRDRVSPSTVQVAREWFQNGI